ncbi:MAG: DUF4388 domain-containing protein [Myxococcota bacterium]
MIDHRRSERLQARVWIQVIGLDDEPRLRRGDISLTGIYFESDQSVGRPDSVQTLQLLPFNKRFFCEVMARVVRTVMVEDVFNEPRVAGVALEFMVDDSTKQRGIAKLMREIAGTRELPPGKRPEDYLKRLDGAWRATPGIFLHAIDNNGMVLETDWKVEAGESISCEILAPTSGRRLRIHGTAVAIEVLESDGKNHRCRVEVSFGPSNPKRPDPEEAEVEGVTLHDAMAVLLEETLVLKKSPAAPRDDHHPLEGALERVQLMSLLGYLAVEQLSGILRITRQGRDARLLVSRGRVLDVQGVSPGLPMEVLAELARWDTGAFHFSRQDVDSPDKVGMETSALLLALARYDVKREQP